MNNIALYGGTFNPPHIAHATVIETLIRANIFDEIWVMPSGDRADKDIKTSKEDRVNMVNIMVKELFSDGTTQIKLSRFEIDNPKVTRTYETKIKLEKLYPNSKLHFVIGSDILGDIKSSWYRGEELFKSMNFIVLPHGRGYMPHDLPDNFLVLKDMIVTDLSSTFIRKVISEGSSGAPYITPGVARYIKDNNLYKK